MLLVSFSLHSNMNNVNIFHSLAIIHYYITTLYTSKLSLIYNIVWWWWHARARSHKHQNHIAICQVNVSSLAMKLFCFSFGFLLCVRAYGS